MIYGYIRVSSNRQTVENQRFEILKFCARNNVVVDGWIEETISGTKAYKHRALGKLLRQVQIYGVKMSSTLWKVLTSPASSSSSPSPRYGTTSEGSSAFPTLTSAVRLSSPGISQATTASMHVPA